MTTVTSRTVTSTRREWIVPAAPPWGAFLGDVRDAIAFASIAYRETHGLPKDAPLADDALRFHVGDEEIVISFTVEEPER
ncbi:hypothetical protein [Streptomyces malaysiensis]|uniref:hypothetical protein n=1 Tax=Streptomyces malaysiensis TaxID=92644 RepID=UPI00321FE6C8|nr:hypothetical protein [Streptomyces malaysiensis]